MKILVNISHLNKPKTGIEHYTVELLTRLMQHPEVEDIIGFDALKLYPRQKLQSKLHAQETNASPIKPIKYKLKQTLKVIPGLRVLYHKVWSRLHQRRLNAYAHKGYLYWEPNYITVPYQGKTFPVIHDLSDIQCPQYHIKEKAQWYAENIPKSVQKAERVQTVSQYSKQQIIQTFKVPEHKIDIIPPGVDDQFYPRTEQQTSPVLQKYGLAYKKYLLSVSTLEPRKNLKGLFTAWVQLPEAIKKQYPLVLVGKNGWLNETFNQTVQPYVNKGQIILTGHVPTEELPHLYSGAKLFAYLSFYEGYGMPIAEAICCGTQVLASNTTAMPEAGKTYATYVSPEDISAITQRLQVLLQKSYSHQTNIDRQVYSWEYAIQSLIQSLQKGNITK